MLLCSCLRSCIIAWRASRHTDSLVLYFPLLPSPHILDPHPLLLRTDWRNLTSVELLLILSQHGRYDFLAYHRFSRVLSTMPCFGPNLYTFTSGFVERV